ncbi:MAG: alpha/beta hydrolase [Bacteroidota bacterium]
MTKISKNAFDKELRPILPFQFLSFLMRKKWGVPIMHKMFSGPKGRDIKGLHNEERYIASQNGGPDIRIRIFRPPSDEVLPALLYIHGGGYLIGVPEIALDKAREYIRRRACVVIAPDYRKGFSNPYPAAFHDCYDTLLWMKENADSLGIRGDKFAVGGHSAGGGLTAAVSLKACDTGEVDIAFQMPIYPMIDHRQNTDSAKAMDRGVPCWNARNSETGWGSYLQNISGEVPAYASPALGTRYEHLPPTITFVGELEPFKDETINYVEALKKANVPVKFALYEKAYHAFESLAPKAKVSQEANQFQYESWAEYYDRYFD